LFKKGCLLRSVALIIVFSAILVYLFDKYGKQFYESSKDKIYRSFIAQLESNLNDISVEVISDSIKTNFIRKIDSIKQTDVASAKNEFDKVIADLKKYINENSAKQENFDELKKIVEEYEQFKKN
jgi:hypothetical protein